MWAVSYLIWIPYHPQDFPILLVIPYYFTCPCWNAFSSPSAVTQSDSIDKSKSIEELLGSIYVRRLAEKLSEAEI